MGWIGWILVVVIVVLPLGLLCFSAISTSLEIWRKSQPFVDSFFDALYTLMFKRTKIERTSVKPKSN